MKGIDDKAVTNNGGSLKVLATVSSTVYTFVEKYIPMLGLSQLEVQK